MELVPVGDDATTAAAHRLIGEYLLGVTRAKAHR
jgi:hypothetical protein